MKQKHNFLAKKNDNKNLLSQNHLESTDVV